MFNGLRTYRTLPRARQPLIDFMAGALVHVGCRIIYASPATSAPFVISFETPSGERQGIVAYAFLATRTPTRNRPSDERSFQLKYGNKSDFADDNVHRLWQDPTGVFTTLLVGIDPVEGFFVAADPVLRSPTKLFIRLEFKDAHAERIKTDGWHAWEREIRPKDPEDVGVVEVIVGGRREQFLDLVRCNSPPSRPQRMCRKVEFQPCHRPDLGR